MQEWNFHNYINFEELNKINCNYVSQNRLPTTAKIHFLSLKSGY